MSKPPYSTKSGGHLETVATLRSLPVTLLDSAEDLARKTARLSGLLAPQTGQCLASLLRGSDELPVEVDPMGLMREFEQAAVERLDLRFRIVAAIYLHYLMLAVQPNEAVAHPLTMKMFGRLGLYPHLWLSAAAMHSWRSSFPSENPSSPQSLEMILAACIEEVDFISEAFSTKALRERVSQSFKTNHRFAEIGLSQASAPAVVNLLIQGSQPLSEFEAFTGLPQPEAPQEIRRLEDLGVVVRSPSYIEALEPGLPSWFAHDILPHLASPRSR